MARVQSSLFSALQQVPGSNLLPAQGRQRLMGWGGGGGGGGGGLAIPVRHFWSIAGFLMEMAEENHFPSLAKKIFGSIPCNARWVD